MSLKVFFSVLVALSLNSAFAKELDKKSDVHASSAINSSGDKKSDHVNSKEREHSIATLMSTTTATPRR